MKSSLQRNNSFGAKWGKAKGLNLALLINCGIGIIPIIAFLLAAKRYIADVDRVKHIVLTE